MAPTSIPLQDTERALVAVLLADPSTIIPVSAILKPDDLSDTVCRRIFTTCLYLAQNQKVPNVYTVSAAVSDVSLDILQEIQKLANKKLVAEVLALAEIIRQEAMYRRVAAVTSDMAQVAVARPKDLNAFIYSSMQQLGAAVEGRTDRPSDLLTIGREVDELLQDESGVQGIPTGLGWLTNRTGGWRPGNIISLIAPYKARKSSCARNMLLASARDHRQTCIYLLEGSRADLYMDLWAMIATERLRDNLTDAEFATEATLDGMHLRFALRSPAQHKALSAARRELDDLAQYLHISDGRDGIGSLDTFSAKIRRDHFLYHTEIFFVDHLQLLDSGKGSLFENVERAVGEIQHFSSAEGVVSVVLSQKNEMSIANDDNYSPGVKGGGALAAASDYILTLRYDGANFPQLLTVRLKHSRRAQPGMRNYVINPSSGLLLREATGQQGNAHDEDE